MRCGVVGVSALRCLRARLRSLLLGALFLTFCGGKMVLEAFPEGCSTFLLSTSQDRDEYTMSRGRGKAGRAGSTLRPLPEDPASGSDRTLFGLLGILQ